MKQLRLIWAALLAGLGLYTALVFLVTLTGTVRIDVLDRGLLNLGGVVVVIYMVGGVLLRRRMVARIDPDAPAEAKASAYTTALIVGAALTESGGMLLVTMALMAGAPTWALAGGGAAVALMLAGRPDPAEVGLTE